MKTLVIRNFFKKSVSFFVAVVMLVGMIAIVPVASASADSIDSPDVFLKQQSSNTCTLASAAMMMRRKSILLEDSDWERITEASIKSRAWTDDGGLWSQFITCGMTITKMWDSYNSVSALKKLLNKYPEGVVIHIKNSKIQHGVLLHSYDSDGNFYCVDPAPRAPSGIIKLTESHYADVYSSQSEIIAALQGYAWVVEKYETGNPDDYTVPTSTLSSGSKGSDVKWVQSVLYKVGISSRMDIDGNYGPATTNNVKTYQSSHQLSVTGKVDSNTIAAMKKSWQSIKNNGTDDPIDSSDETDTSSTSQGIGTYQVTTEGGNLNLRSSPSTDATILTRIPNGTRVVVTAISNGFGKTTYNGYTGWASMTYLKFISSSTTITTDTSTSTTTTDTSTSTTQKIGTYQVTTQGGNLILRSSPSTDASLLTLIPNGTKVVVTAISNGFGKTTYNGYTGWASMTYLKFISSSTTITTDTSTSTTTDTSTSTTQKTGTYQVTTQGGNLILRSSPSTSASMLTLIPNGTNVVVTEISSGFGKTTYNGYTGWASMTYLKFISSSTTITTDTSASTTQKTGTYQVTTQGGNLNLRSSPSTDATILTRIPNGTKVVVTEISSGFGKTTYNGYTGWASMTYLNFISSSTTITTDTSASTTQQTGTYKVTTQGGSLIIRSLPTSSAMQLATIPNGTQVVITEISNGYGKTTYNGYTGWISMSYLQFISSSTTITTDTSTSTIQQTGTYKVTTQGGNLIMRSLPTSSAMQLATIPNGTQVVISAISNGYGKTTYNGNTGWISMSYLEFISSSTTITTDTSASTIQQTGTYQVTIPAGSLILRSDPITRVQVALIPNGTVLTITEIDDGWGKTEYKGISGWVSMTWMTKYSGGNNDNVSSGETGFFLGAYYVTLESGSLRLRESSSSASETLATVPNGTKLVITEIVNNFGRTTYNGIVGWVCMAFLVKADDSESGTGNNTGNEVSSDKTDGKASITLKIQTDNGSAAKIYENRDTSSKVLGTIPNGTSIVSTESNDGWARVTYKGISGWIHQNDILLEENTNVEENKAYVIKTLDIIGTVPMREEPKSSSKKVGKIPNGTTVIVEAKEKKWSKITYGGVNGWVHNMYLSKGDKTFMDAVNNGINAVVDKLKDTDYEELVNQVIGLINKVTGSGADDPFEGNSEVSGNDVHNGGNSETIGGNDEIVNGNNTGKPGGNVDFRYGDINNDGVINLNDVVLYQKIKAGLADFTQLGLMKADVDGNGTYDMSDIVEIQRYIAKLITVFKAENIDYDTVG